MLKHKAVISLVTQVIIYLIGFFSSFFVARYMGAEPLGVLSSTQAYINMFGLLGGLGFGLAHFKKVSEGTISLDKCNGTYFTIRFILSAFMFVVMILVFYSINFFTGKYPVDPKYIPFFWIVAISFTLGNISMSIENTFSARLEVTKNSIILITRKLANTSLKIIVAIAGLSTIYLAWSNMVATIIAIGVAIYLFRHYPVGRFDKDTFKVYMVFALSITGMQFVEKISSNIDRVLIGYFINETEVGYYTVARSLSNVFLYASFLLINLLLPTYSKMFGRGDMVGINLLASKVLRYLSLLVTPIMMFIIIHAQSIINFIYGEEFLYATSLLQFLAVNVMFSYFLQPYMNIFTGTNRVRYVFYIGAFGSALNIILNVILIPESLWGIPLLGLKAKGAAVAVVTDTVVRWILYRYLALRKYKAKIQWNILLHVASAAGIQLLLTKFTPSWISNKLLLSLLVSFFLSIILFYTILFLLKEIRREDINYYAQVFSLKKLGKGMQQELKKPEDI